MLHNTNRCSYSYMIQCIRTRVQNIRVLEKRDLFCEENLVVHVYMYLYACGRMSKDAFCPVKKAPCS